MKGRGGKRPVNARERQGKKMFLMILPFLILCFLFSYFPLHGWIYAFYDYKAPLKLSQCPFVGFKWFRMFFSNETQMAQLWQVMKNTFAMSFLSIVTSILPLGFAIFLSEIKCKWFKSLVQTMTTLPNFISWGSGIFGGIQLIFQYRDGEYTSAEPRNYLRGDQVSGQ